jgi:hypothetical protein
VISGYEKKTVPAEKSTRNSQFCVVIYRIVRKLAEGKISDCQDFSCRNPTLTAEIVDPSRKTPRS